jgi:GTP diphosphokinase / guanosine-3',5'-bis(diphosphate) 3'-diphosphatase
MANDKKGLLADITSVLASAEINILRANVVTTEEKRAIGTFELEVRDLKHLQAAFRALGKLKHVLKVERVRGAPGSEKEEEEEKKAEV